MMTILMMRIASFETAICSFYDMFLAACCVENRNHLLSFLELAKQENAPCQSLQTKNLKFYI